jgi:serine/threonine-protein kinase
MHTTDPQQTLSFGKYRVVEVLGRGAMGVVYKAHDPAIDRHVAVKTIRKDLLDGGQASTMIARFRNEAVAAGRLAHPGIVAVYDFGEDATSSYIVMEFAPGEHLDDYVKRQGGLLPLPEVGAIMAQLLDALGAAHAAGVVHRDIKPANLIMSNGRLKITDFGIARVSASHITQTGMAVGTPVYMSPEQYMGTAVDNRADIFAAGVLLYELITGTRPFDGESVQEIAYKICHVDPVAPTKRRPELSPRFDGAALNALAKQREARFRSTQDFARCLADAVANLPIPQLKPQSRVPVASLIDGRTPVAGAPAMVSPAQLEKATAAMTHHVGPIAKVLVKKAAAHAANFHDLCVRLCVHLSNDDERKKFMKQVGEG